MKKFMLWMRVITIIIIICACYIMFVQILKEDYENLIISGSIIIVCVILHLVPIIDKGIFGQSRGCFRVLQST